MIRKSPQELNPQQEEILKKTPAYRTSQEKRKLIDTFCEEFSSKFIKHHSRLARDVAEDYKQRAVN